jgi:hypothetical protein
MSEKKDERSRVKLDPRKLTLREALRLLNAKQVDDGACLALRDFFKQGGWRLYYRPRGTVREETSAGVRELKPACGDVRAIRFLPDGNVEIYDDAVGRTGSGSPLVTGHLSWWERRELRELLREGVPASREGAENIIRGPSPRDEDTLTWLERVSSQISKLMSSDLSEKRELGKVLCHSLQLLNRLARLPLGRGAYPLYLEPEEVVADPKRQQIPSSDPEAPWWMRKSRYEFFRRHSRELILRAGQREELRLRASDPDKEFVDAVRLIAREPEVRTVVREKDPARRFAAQIALAIGRQESLEAVDRWYGGLSKLGLYLEQKLDLV